MASKQKLKEAKLSDTVLKRIYTYLREMFPPFQRALLASGLVFTILFVILACFNIGKLHIGPVEYVLVLTVFSFLLSLRIADEFKDLDTDYKNFPKRPLPSGRVKKSDLIFLLGATQLPTIILNCIVLPENIAFFMILYTYGILMSVWFFLKKYIKNNLLLALLTHNPVQLLLNSYVASAICFSYHVPFVSKEVLLVIVALYLPGAVWEIGRKIRSPTKETAYTTYSKLWGYKKAVIVIAVLVLAAFATTAYLVSHFSQLGVAALAVITVSMLAGCMAFVKKPEHFDFGTLSLAYIYVEQLTLLVVSFLKITGHTA